MHGPEKSTLNTSIGSSPLAMPQTLPPAHETRIRARDIDAHAIRTRRRAPARLPIGCPWRASQARRYSAGNNEKPA
jgi:hypothetical protein